MSPKVNMLIWDLEIFKVLDRTLFENLTSIRENYCLWNILSTVLTVVHFIRDK